LSGAYVTYVYAVGHGVTAGQVYGGTVAIHDDVVVEMQNALFAAGAV
jgi:hypothetical protein